MGLLRRVVAYPVVVLSEVPSRSKNWVDVRLLRKHKSFSLSGVLPVSGDVAILVSYPGTTTFGSVERIALWLEEAGYSLIIVINENDKARQWHSKLSSPKRALLLRPNIGSDFGAYKLALDLISKDAKSLQNIALVNDSMIYPPNSHDSVLGILDKQSKSSCNSLFLNMQAVIHAPSMLLRFGPTVTSSVDFWRFWSHYYPYSSKRKVIKRGEHRLTKVLGWKAVQPAFSSHTLPKVTDMTIAEYNQLLRWSYMTDPVFAESVKLAKGSQEYRSLLQFALENFHVSDSLGLYCARQFHAPLKLDLAKRGLTTKQAMLDAMAHEGLSPEELGELQKILDRNVSYQTKSLFQRIFA